ncbi:MAG: hypothetical protein V1798_06390 [Pseudomonadota bacterium]
MRNLLFRVMVVLALFGFSSVSADQQHAAYCYLTEYQYTGIVWKSVAFEPTAASANDRCPAAIVVHLPREVDRGHAVPHGGNTWVYAPPGFDYALHLQGADATTCYYVNLLPIALLHGNSENAKQITAKPATLECHAPRYALQ